MAKLDVRWTGETLTYRQILDRPGVYLNLANGNILRHHSATEQARESRDSQTDAPVYVWLTENLALPDAELRDLAVSRVGVAAEDLGRVVIGAADRAK